MPAIKNTIWIVKLATERISEEGCVNETFLSLIFCVKSILVVREWFHVNFTHLLILTVSIFRFGWKNIMIKPTMKAKRSKTSATFVTKGLITKACWSYILTKNILRLERKDISVKSVIKVRNTIDHLHQFFWAQTFS